MKSIFEYLKDLKFHKHIEVLKGKILIMKSRDEIKRESEIDSAFTMLKHNSKI